LVGNHRSSGFSAEWTFLNINGWKNLANSTQVLEKVVDKKSKFFSLKQISFRPITAYGPNEA